MFIRDPELVKKFFLTGNKPSQATWNNFFDFMASIAAEIEDALLQATKPVVIVPDEAGRLAAGPGMLVGHRAKQMDNGITYVKQQDDGTDPADWEGIGDTIITIPDVALLPQELADRLRGDVDDSTPFKVQVYNDWITEVCSTPAAQEMGGYDRVRLDFEGPGKFYYFLPDQDFTITVQRQLSDQILQGIDIKLLVMNSTPGVIEFLEPLDLPDIGKGVSWFRMAGTETFPVVIPPGTAVEISIKQVPIPETYDPAYPVGGGTYYFMTFQFMAEPVKVIAAWDEMSSTMGYSEGELSYPTFQDFVGGDLGLTDCEYENMIIPWALSDDAVGGDIGLTECFYELMIVEVILPDDAVSGDIGLTECFYALAIISDSGADAGGHQANFDGGIYFETIKPTGLLQENVELGFNFDGGEHTEE